MRFGQWPVSSPLRLKSLPSGAKKNICVRFRTDDIPAKVVLFLLPTRISAAPQRPMALRKFRGKNATQVQLLGGFFRLTSEVPEGFWDPRAAKPPFCYYLPDPKP